MFILRRLILWLVPVLWFVGLELIKYSTIFFWPVSVIILIYLMFACFVICKGRFNKAFWHFLIMPIFFSASGFVLLLFSVSPIFFHLLALGVGLALYLLLKQYFTFFYLPFKYQPYSLESLTFYISLILFYFLFSGFFASLTLLKFNVILALIIALPIVGLVLYQFFWVHKIIWPTSSLFVIVMALIILESALVVSYLPIGYYVSAFVITTLSYVMLGIGRAYLQNVLDKKIVAGYLSVAGIMVLLVLISARWS